MAHGRVPHLKFGSPFQQSSNGGNPVVESLPVVLWDASDADSDKEETDGADATIARASRSPRCEVPVDVTAHSRLGRVTFCIRGRNQAQQEMNAHDNNIPMSPATCLLQRGNMRLRGYSIRSARIIDFVNGQCLVVPAVVPCFPPALQPPLLHLDGGESGFGVATAQVSMFAQMPARACTHVQKM